jgi:hypothetical protein
LVANEDFIEIRPHSGEEYLRELLAFLNSTVGEYLVRVHSFQYGGGVFNLNPGDVPKIPVPDPAEMDHRGKLGSAWQDFVQAHNSSDARRKLDEAVTSGLGIPRMLLDELTIELELLRDRTNVARISHA